MFKINLDEKKHVCLKTHHLANGLTHAPQICKFGIHTFFQHESEGLTWRIIAGLGDTWLVAMVIVIGPLRIGL